MKKIYLIISLLLFSCQNNNDYITRINLSKKVKCIQYSEFADSIGHIQLEAKNECLIGNIDLILNDDSLLFLLDQRQKTIFIFSESGKFINKIDNIGKGEGQYISLNSFCLDVHHKRIYILDELQRTILKYNYKGKYLCRINIKKEGIVRSIGFLNNFNFVFFTPDLITKGKDGAWEVDTLGLFVKEFKRVDPMHKLIFIPFPYYSIYEEKISFYDCFTDEIFSLKKGEISKEFSFNLDQKIPEKFLSKEDGVNGEGTANYYMNCHIAETNNLFYLQFHSSKLGKANVFFDKNNGKLIMADSLKNNFDEGNFIKFFSYKRNSLITAVWKKKDLDNKNPELQLLYLKEHL